MLPLLLLSDVINMAIAHLCGWDGIKNSRTPHAPAQEGPCAFVTSASVCGGDGEVRAGLR